VEPLQPLQPGQQQIQGQQGQEEQPLQLSYEQAAQLDMQLQYQVETLAAFHFIHQAVTRIAVSCTDLFLRLTRKLREMECSVRGSVCMLIC